MAELNSEEFFEIDGGFEEGGGQLLRFAVAVSAIVGKPIKINNIRKGRPKPGLSPQHLKGLELVRDICDGQLLGATGGSTEISFRPGKLKSGLYKADTKTAGSIALLLQVSLPCLLFADGESSLELKGGTEVPFAPTIDYIILVFNLIAEKFGICTDLQILKRGYYPKGGGVVIANVKSFNTLPISPIVITERGDLKRITGCSFVAGTVRIEVAHTKAQEALKILKREYRNIDIDVERLKISPDKAIGNGSGIILVGETTTGCRIAGTALFKREVTHVQEANDAAQMLISNLKHGGCVDEHLQDQLILFMALAKGRSRIKSGPVTSHTKTVIHLAELLTNAKFCILRSEQDDSWLIECEGHGFSRTI